MKHIILSITVFFSLFLIIKNVYAITPSITPTTSKTPSIGKKDENLIDEINNLREKVASRVAQLNLVEKRGIFLTAQDVSGNKITGEDHQVKIRLVDVDELTKFSSPSAKSFGISDITKGSRISVLGLYNKQSKRILARFIETVILPSFVQGAVSEIDKANFTITVTSENKTITLVDIENVTKKSSYTKKGGINKLGFSKLEVGNRVYVVGYANLKEKNRITATRLIVFPELPKNPKINIQQVSSSYELPSATPSAKVTPSTNL